MEEAGGMGKLLGGDGLKTGAKFSIGEHAAVEERSAGGVKSRLVVVVGDTADAPPAAGVQ